MKKILTILSCAVLFALSSCTKQYIAAPGTTNQTYYADVATSDWVAYTDNSGTPSYRAPISIHLSDSFAQIGGIIVAISYDGGMTYEQLPEVYNNISFSYTYNAGNVTLYAQNALGTAAAMPTSAIKVKIILVDSNG